MPDVQAWFKQMGIDPETARVSPLI
jgi:hypothetical protein